MLQMISKIIMMKESRNVRLKGETSLQSSYIAKMDCITARVLIYTKHKAQHNQTNTNIHNTLLISSSLGAIMP